MEYRAVPLELVLVTLATLEKTAASVMLGTIEMVQRNVKVSSVLMYV